MKTVCRSNRVTFALAVLALAGPVLAHGWSPPAPPPPVSAVAPTSARDAASNGTQSGTRGAAVQAVKPKTTAAPWLENMRVAWQPKYLPAISTGGYGARAGTIADGLRLSPAEGGWARDGRPVIVFAYDATNLEHQRILTVLDTDARVRTASQFFNCFRIDVSAFTEKSATKDARLSVFTSDGTLVGELTAQRKLTGVYDVIESAWRKQSGNELANRAAKMETLLKTKAAAEHFIPLCQAGIVCPDCGHERLDVLERIAELKARIEACDRAMEELRTVAKN